jgi:hypothetical protein
LGYFEPRRAWSAGRFGGLPAGCWAADPGGRVETAVGRFSRWPTMTSDPSELF